MLFLGKLSQALTSDFGCQFTLAIGDQGPWFFQQLGVT